MNRNYLKSFREVTYYTHNATKHVVSFDGERYRREDMAGDTGILEAFNEKDYTLVARHKEYADENGDYPWDHWKKWALEDGVSKDLAELGRGLIREADQHCWSEALQAECGWADDGRAMIELALKHPEEARKRWLELLSTDGERGFINANGKWEPY